MKATIHLKNEDYNFHPAIGIEVELPTRPVIGDVLFLSKADKEELIRQIEEWSEGRSITEDRNPYWWEYGGRYGWNEIDSSFYVLDIAFFPNKNEDKYELHVDLSKDH